MSLLDLIFRPKKRSRLEAYEKAASAIESFIAGSGGKWDWDDYTSIKEDDAFLESVRLRCISVYDEYPADQTGHYCSKAGIEVLRDLARSVREKLKTIQNENHGA